MFPEQISFMEEFAKVASFKLNKDADAQEIINVLCGVNGIILGINPVFSKEVLERLPNLKIIARTGVGYNNIDIEAASNLGIITTNVEHHIERNAVAEQAVALLMSTSRQICDARTAVKERRWAERAKFDGIEFTGKTIGVIGHGAIGSRFAEIMEFGFNARILAHDPHCNKEGMENRRIKFCNLDTLFKESDAISLHCVTTKETENIINKSNLEKTKKGLILINTGRGDLINEKELIPFLESKHVRAYATDVTRTEPIEDDHPFLHLDNVLIVPHLGGYTPESLKGIGETMIHNMKDVLVNKKLPFKNLINKDLKPEETRMCQ